MALSVMEQPIIVAEDERPALERLARIASDELRLEAKLIGPRGEEIPISASLRRVLEQATHLLARGEAVTIVPVDKEMTTQEAADFMNMSRQYLVQLLERGEIPFSKVGTHRRVKFGDLAAYKARRATRRRAALDEITRIGQDLEGHDARG